MVQVNAELADVREDEEFKRNMTHALAENLAELRPDLMQLENGEPCYSCVRVVSVMIYSMHIFYCNVASNFLLYTAIMALFLCLSTPNAIASGVRPESRVMMLRPVPQVLLLQWLLSYIQTVEIR
eukprot:1155649-Pelagomonas_calceolata.AAC.2